MFLWSYRCAHPFCQSLLLKDRLLSCEPSRGRFYPGTLLCPQHDLCYRFLNREYCYGVKALP
ncbi:ORF256 [White spot syndrome virus]|uniref:ORF256 n=1 Tax=White spot syndrome virus TaxID=342409 RepID=A0A2D3I731_9VIRU|nr:ORF256 [White spot syndrome virus]